jgi:ribosomal-protein-alanine N-acetyltransferase
MTAASEAVGGAELEAMRWWHLPEVMVLESELFGDEQWTEETFWSELAFCPPGLLGGSPRRYWVALGPSAVVRPGVPAERPVLGYAGLAAAGEDAYVQTIGVAGAAQRQGIGSLLLHRLLTDARQTGAGTCWLEVRADNGGAQAMYERFGFRLRGRRRGYYQPSGTDALVMSAELAGSDGEARGRTR